MIKYQYQILRYIHDQFTGEFGNVGIVLYAPEKNYLRCKVIGRYSRLSDFFGEINGQFLINSLKHFESGINKIAEGFNDSKTQIAKELALITSAILPKDDSALQLTDVAYGLDVNPETTMTDLFERVIEKYNGATQFTANTDQYAWSRVYKTYFDKYGITRNLKKHIVETQKDVINFDKAWKNGAWNCYQALSFDLKTEDAIKSKVYKWSGIIHQLETAHEKIKLYLLTTSPKQHKEFELFIKEMLTLKNNSLAVDLIEEDKAEEFAASVLKEMIESKIIDTNDELPY